MRRIITLLCLMVFMCGCAGSTVRTQMEVSKHSKAMIKLKPDMSSDEVVEIMGQPNRTELHRGKEGEQILVYLYITEYPTWKRTEAHYTPFVFENNKLTGWGWDHLNGQAQRYEFIIKDMY